MTESQRLHKSRCQPPATRQIVQAGLGTTPDRGIIQSLWFEIPANCDLQCGYCFCATQKDKPDLRPDNLAFDPAHPQTYALQPYVENVLAPFARAIEAWNGATVVERIRDFGCPPENAEGFIRGRVAIPGAGEPFHPRSLPLVSGLIEQCERLDLHLTIFTAGHWITRELAAELSEKDVVLLVKCNSRDRKVQNRAVGQKANGTYFDRREKGLALLMEEGFNRPFGQAGTLRYQETRMGIVTSVMKENLDELTDLLRYARRNDIVFDCDTILQRGRGDHCRSLPDDETTAAAFRKLQLADSLEFGRSWDISRSYVGTTCDRFRHHLYVDRTGTIAPCVGSVDVPLGSVREGADALYRAWNSPLMKQVIRRHKYDGPCATCLNGLEEKCYSCLGRCRNQEVRLNGQDGDACISTEGCWNRRPRPEEESPPTSSKPR